MNDTSANYIVATALLLGMPLFVVFGALSDRIGRKRIMMAGCLLAAVSYIPIYQAMQAAAGSNVVTAISQRNPVTGAISLTPQTLVDGAAAAGRTKSCRSRTSRRCSANPVAWQLILLVFIQVIFVTMVYGPIAAYLVEAFPAKIRYTALSLPYHIGNGVFGGLLPLIGLVVVAQTGNIYAGLYYPIVVAALTFVVGSLTLEGDAQRADLERSRQDRRPAEPEPIGRPCDVGRSRRAANSRAPSRRLSGYGCGNGNKDNGDHLQGSGR